MNYLSEFMTLGVIGFLGAMSPGPDFALVTQNSLQHGRQAGLYTTLGIALGCLIHASYCVIGIGFIITQSLFLFNCIKYLGAGYLIYLGLKGLLSKKQTTDIHAVLSTSTLTSKQALRSGFLVNVLNPKASLCYLSIFTQLISPQTPLPIQALYGLELAAVAFCWFAILSWLLSHPNTKRRLLKVQQHLEKLLGGFFIFLGLKVASLSV